MVGVEEEYDQVENQNRQQMLQQIEHKVHRPEGDRREAGHQLHQLGLARLLEHGKQDVRGGQKGESNRQHNQTGDHPGGESEKDFLRFVLLVMVAVTVCGSNWCEHNIDGDVVGSFGQHCCDQRLEMSDRRQWLGVVLLIV